jgi:hypothetical protein
VTYGLIQIECRGSAKIIVGEVALLAAIYPGGAQVDGPAFFHGAECDRIAEEIGIDRIGVAEIACPAVQAIPD